MIAAKYEPFIKVGCLIMVFAMFLIPFHANGMKIFAGIAILFSAFNVYVHIRSLSIELLKARLEKERQLRKLMKDTFHGCPLFLSAIPASTRMTIFIAILIIAGSITMILK